MPFVGQILTALLYIEIDCLGNNVLSILIKLINSIIDLQIVNYINMKDYWKYKRGSEWRKWDLHVHTPGTKKNDHFDGQDLVEKWERYVNTINSLDHEISVIGITDYFSIENYFKFKMLVDHEDIKCKFDMIIPNIELRILPVTSSSTPINLHCIFNPTLDNEVEDRFLSKLSFRHSDTNYSASKQSLIRLGRSIVQNTNLDEELSIIKGVEQFVVSLDLLRKVFDDDQNLRDNTIIVVSNKSHDGVTGIVKHEDFFTDNGSQLDTTRESVYQLADAIFSSNEGDRSYFIGQKSDNKETVIRKCGSLKPCFHGSDAHSNAKIFKPYDNRFCWIKSDPTFEGLKQTLYEPEDRVKIQAFRPDVKNDRYIISDVRFKDSTETLFGKQEILLNENLNSIIGGKSAGKSLLLYSIANSIDPDQVEKTHKRLGFEGYKFKVDYDFEVRWKSGVVNTLKGGGEKTQKIIYIPQLYINYLVEKDNKADLNQLVENILLQNTDFKSFFEDIKEKIAENNSNLDTLLTSYIQTRQKILETQKNSKELGKSSDILIAIEKIQKAIAEGQKLSNLSPEEFKTYNAILENKSKIEEQLIVINSKKTTMGGVLLEIKNNRDLLFGGMMIGNDLKIIGSVDKILNQLSELPEDIKSIRHKIEFDYNGLIGNLEKEIGNLNFEEKIKHLTEALTKEIALLKPFLDKLAGQKELKKLTDNLDIEKKKYTLALALEKQHQIIIQDYTNLRNRTALLIKERIEKYEKVVKNVNETRREIGSGVTLECTLIYKQNDFPLFHQVNKAAISKEHFFNDLFSDGKLNYAAISDLYSKQLWIKEDKVLKAGGDENFELPLKQGYSLEEVLRGLIRDSFTIDYSVTYKGDDLLRMSPGKKGTVLLILFLQISSSEYPILIDQPEDNLDNRTIYELLCKMIKEKKKDRQIIIVSHNANLVVATDSENIIIANQEGQENIGQTSHYQFEYVNGSIEHTFPLDKSIKEVLYKQGIREHICDILEGGNEAFKQREKKYSIK
jgi:hypothetical protein